MCACQKSRTLSTVLLPGLEDGKDITPESMPEVADRVHGGAPAGFHRVMLLRERPDEPAPAGLAWHRPAPAGPGRTSRARSRRRSSARAGNTASGGAGEALP